MDMQLTCTKAGHNNKPIRGICMAEQCKSDQRTVCFTCIQKVHVDCKNQFQDKDEFINSLEKLKINTLQGKEPPLVLLLRQLAEKSQQFIQLLDSFTKDSLSGYKIIDLINHIDQILKNQNVLSTLDWNQGYTLLIQKAIILQSTKGLIEQLNEIKATLDQITDIQTKQQECQYLETNSKLIPQSLNNVIIHSDIMQNPVVINTIHKVLTIALSPNGKHIASAGHDAEHSISIWDLNTGNQIGTCLKGHTQQIKSINYSKCGLYIVSGSDDSTIRQWSLGNHEQFGETITVDQGPIHGVLYTVDQTYIVSCQYIGTLRIWNQKTGKEQVDQYIYNKNSICCLTLSPIKNEVAFGDTGGTIVIWDYKKHKQSGQVLIGHTKCVNTIQYSTDGLLIISGGSDLIIILWDAHKRTQIRSFSGHSSDILSVNFSPDQKQIISGGCDKQVMLLDRVTGKQIGQTLTHHHCWVRSAQFSLCGKYIITGADDRQIWIMKVPMQQEAP